MPLNTEDREWVKLIAAEISREITESVIRSHIEACPHGKTLLASKMLIIGLCVGSGIASGSVVLGLAKIIFG